MMLIGFAALGYAGMVDPSARFQSIQQSFSEDEAAEEMVSKKVQIDSQPEALATFAAAANQEVQSAGLGG
jgi:hypothetical protein